MRVYRYEDDSLMLHNDLYQINMAKVTGMMVFMKEMQCLICISEICHLEVDMLF